MRDKIKPFYAVLILLGVLALVLVASASRARQTSGPIVAKYMDRLATDPNCVRVGQFYFKTTTSKTRQCSTVGTPGTWADVGGGGASYLVYSALLSQTGTNAPTAIVLANTLGGTPTFTRSSAGVYTLTLSTAFTVNKTFLSGTVESGGGVSANFVMLTRANANEIIIKTVSADASFPVQDLADGLLNNSSVEIRVYP
jgi:hypothetical protein